jgi:hypothetical protein
VVLSLGVVGTHAYWNPNITVLGATIKSGSIDLKVNGLDGTVAFSTLALTGMTPGTTAAGVLTVSNTGLSPLKYTATSTASNTANGLAAALVVKVTGDASAPAKTCTGATLAGTGTSLNGSVVSTGRRLAAGASETLCVQVTLPSTAPSSLQGATTVATLTFSATSDMS